MYVVCVSLQAHESISVEYEKIMKDLQTLNALSDSNRLLRDENKSLEEKVCQYKMYMYKMYMYIRTRTCTYMYIHVGTCTCVCFHYLDYIYYMSPLLVRFLLLKPAIKTHSLRSSPSRTHSNLYHHKKTLSLLRRWPLRKRWSVGTKGLISS